MDWQDSRSSPDTGVCVCVCVCTAYLSKGTLLNKKYPRVIIPLQFPSVPQCLCLLALNLAPFQFTLLASFPSAAVFR